MNTISRRLFFAGIAVISLSVLALAQTDPSPIQRMVATERAFAATAAEIGVRDSFLTFFADDAVSLEADAKGAAVVARAKDGFVAMPPTHLPLATKLMWAPFTGQVSSDGTLGWLTGGYVNFDIVANAPTTQGAYFSVWKKQADGTWRVWLDYGISLRQLWTDAAPFRAAPEPDAGAAGAPSDSLAQAEAAVANGGGGWLDRLSSNLRLHREGQLPMTDHDAVVSWAASEWRSVHFQPLKTEVAASDDLGVTLGGYDAMTIGGGIEHGTWVRVWKRDTTGRWRVVFESSKKN